ncbi:glycosyltransferase family 2 protein [Uliginosibacterium sp. H1]|uniref:glycosyltransferase family 2 protein n=1 Tax=Uliginosibacterium sp. H1 TaxID=3114757 RepID=UPI002E16D2E0|nr:glycosyltransferase [Uliginosibacterium sp. H1]
MPTSPAASICVPVYNGEAYLRPALDSALAQSREDFELLIVDDCSRDSSPEIIREYALRDHRIRHHRNERNLGLVGNWNRCVELARGEWIKFLFQDDLLHPDCLARMTGATESQDAIVFCQRTVLFEEDLAASGRSFYEEHSPLLARTFAMGSHLPAQAITAWTLSNRFLNVLGEPTAMMFKRSVHTDHGPFNPALSILCDIEFALRVGSKHGVRLVPAPLAYFRAHGGSTSGALFDTAQFRHKYLDTIVWLHEMCFAPAYEQLRSIVARELPKLNLRRELLARIQLAHEYIATTAGHSAELAAGMQTGLDDLLQQLPRARPNRLDLAAWRLRKAYWALAR